MLMPRGAYALLADCRRFATDTADLMLMFCHALNLSMPPSSVFTPRAISIFIIFYRHFLATLSPSMSSPTPFTD